jgi:hypothetical protein
LAACVLLAGCARPVKEVLRGGTPEAGGPVVVRTASAAGADAQTAGAKAAKALKEQFGDTVPDAVIVAENFEGRAEKEQVLEGVCSVFPAESVFGLATYGSFGQEGCHAEPSVSLVGIGGSGVAVSAALQRDFGVAEFSMADTEEVIVQRLRKAGRSLGEKLPGSGNDRLLVLLADAHSPKNQLLVEGVQEVVGKDFPIVGGCANKNAGQNYVAYQGRLFSDSGVALMLRGNFQVALAGRRATSNDRVIATAREAAAEARKTLKAKPMAALAFNCAGRQGKLKNIEDELAAIQDALGKGLPLFGCYCAGEMGPLDYSAKRPGVLSGGSGWHIMFALLGQ